MEERTNREEEVVSLEELNEEAKKLKAEKREQREGEIGSMLVSVFERKKQEEADSEQEKENMTLDEYVEKLTADMPTVLREKVQKHIDEFKEYNVPERDLKDKTEKRRKEVLLRYKDNFGMYNKEYSRMLMGDKIEEIFENQPSVEDLKKVARISWDLNGLKAVNDLNGGRHAEGDAYIGIAVEVLQEPSVIALAEKYGLKFQAVHDSGDEFAAIVTSNEPIEPGSRSEEGLNALMMVVQDKINRHKKAGEALDFDNDEVVYNLYKIEMKARGHEHVAPMSPELIEELRTRIPKGYKFKAWMSGDACTLYEALMEYEGGKNDVKEDDNHVAVINKLMGTLIDVSDRRMGKKKTKDKAVIRESGRSGNEEDAMLDRIYNIREAGAELAEDVRSLQARLDLLENGLQESQDRVKRLELGYDDIQKLLESGASANSILETLNRLRE